MSLVREKPELFQKLSEILTKKNIQEREAPVSDYIPFDSQSLPLRVRDWAAGRKTVLEIGSGWGEFTIEFAQKNPDLFIVALEKKKHRVRRSLKNLARENPGNVRWMVMDVAWFLPELFQQESFDRVIINFPDPWPKKRHHKHRIMSESFFRDLTPLCSKGALLEFGTDHWPYMEATLDVLKTEFVRSTWTNIHGEGVLLPSLPDRPVSYFEELKRQEGFFTYFIQLQKNR